jgi:hypothetical protein
MHVGFPQPPGRERLHGLPGIDWHTCCSGHSIAIIKSSQFSASLSAIPIALSFTSPGLPAAAHDIGATVLELAGCDPALALSRAAADRPLAVGTDRDLDFDTREPSYIIGLHLGIAQFRRGRDGRVPPYHGMFLLASPFWTRIWIESNIAHTLLSADFCNNVGQLRPNAAQQPPGSQASLIAIISTDEHGGSSMRR